MVEVNEDGITLTCYIPDPEGGPGEDVVRTVHWLPTPEDLARRTAEGLYHYGGEGDIYVLLRDGTLERRYADRSWTSAPGSVLDGMAGHICCDTVLTITPCPWPEYMDFEYFWPSERVEAEDGTSVYHIDYYGTRTTIKTAQDMVDVLADCELSWAEVCQVVFSLLHVQCPLGLDVDNVEEDDR